MNKLNKIKVAVLTLSMGLISGQALAGDKVGDVQVLAETTAYCSPANPNLTVDFGDIETGSGPKTITVQNRVYCSPDTVGYFYGGHNITGTTSSGENMKVVSFKKGAQNPMVGAPQGISFTGTQDGQPIDFEFDAIAYGSSPALPSSAIPSYSFQKGGTFSLTGIYTISY